jgi:hypothetical protein
MKLLLAFESPTHGDLGAAQLLWHNGYTRLLTLVSEKSADIAAVQEMFRMLRLANFKFLRLSIEELHRQYMRIEAPPEPNVMPQGTFVTPPLPARSAATTGADGHEPPRDVPAGATAPPPVTVTTFADGIAGGMQWLNELFGRIAQSGGEVGEPVQSK